MYALDATARDRGNGRETYGKAFEGAASSGAVGRGDLDGFCLGCPGVDTALSPGHGRSLSRERDRGVDQVQHPRWGARASRGRAARGCLALLPNLHLSHCSRYMWLPRPVGLPVSVRAGGDTPQGKPPVEFENLKRRYDVDAALFNLKCRRFGQCQKRNAARVATERRQAKRQGSVSFTSILPSSPLLSSSFLRRWHCECAEHAN